MIHSASFRDPSGFVFTENNEIFRAVKMSYQQNYEQLMQSGLYDELVLKGLLIPHIEVKKNILPVHESYKIIKPEKVLFISYPYEWCFSQMKDAGLVMLEIQKIALHHGMILKDASAFNIQFHKGRLVLVDTLSFEKYNDNKPWIAYRQFCEHFIAPLALMHFLDQRLNFLFTSNIDGIPLELAVKMLPVKAKLRLGIYMHLILHSRLKVKYSNRNIDKFKIRTISKNSLYGLIHSLDTTIRTMKFKPISSVWSNYSEVTNPVYSENKKQIVMEFISQINPQLIFDIGANTGNYSALINNNKTAIIAIDTDYQCIEKFYEQIKSNNVQNILPLVNDIANPSSSIGWRNNERNSLLERINPDIVLMLAIFHHLVINNQIQLNMIVEFLSNLSKWIIIEYVPESDEQFKLMTQNRQGDFVYYSETCFEQGFIIAFDIICKRKILGSERVLYFMKKK